MVKAAVLTLVLLMAVPTFAGVSPSKTAPDQTVADRNADLATVTNILAIEGVSEALAAQGLNEEEVNARLAALSSSDLNSLAQNLEQVQAAGLSRQAWTYIGIGALAVLLLLALT